MVWSEQLESGDQSVVDLRLLSYTGDGILEPYSSQKGSIGILGTCEV